jgi:hypothetical protein
VAVGTAEVRVRTKQRLSRLVDIVKLSIRRAAFTLTLDALNLTPGLDRADTRDAIVIDKLGIITICVAVALHFEAACVTFLLHLVRIQTALSLGTIYLLRGGRERQGRGLGRRHTTADDGHLLAATGPDRARRECW